ncbi:MAG: hypothetical protein M1831_007502 [Alyxoria varia]|nr:MAG: hypothetical protein M1831_007502 [Alyxoria varia]
MAERPPPHHLIPSMSLDLHLPLPTSAPSSRYFPAGLSQPPEDTTALLSRLSQKPGVTATLILDRSTGAVVRSTGLAVSALPAPANSDGRKTGATATANSDGKSAPGDGTTGADNNRTVEETAKGTTAEGPGAAAANARASMNTTAPALNNRNNGDNRAAPLEQEDGGAEGLKSAEQVARSVWGFFERAGEMIEGMFGVEKIPPPAQGTPSSKGRRQRTEEEDEEEKGEEVRLLRLRTRRREVVVVPALDVTARKRNVMAPLAPTHHMGILFMRRQAEESEEIHNTLKRNTAAQSPPFARESSRPTTYTSPSFSDPSRSPG